MVEVTCANQHVFDVTTDMVMPSSTGKTFVTVCPECGQTVRLRDRDVAEMFGINPKDKDTIRALRADLLQATWQDEEPVHPAPAGEGGGEDEVFTATIEEGEDVTGSGTRPKRYRVDEDEEDEDEEDEEYDEEDEEYDEDEDEPEPEQKPKKRQQKPKRRKQRGEEVKVRPQYQPQVQTERKRHKFNIDPQFLLADEEGMNIIEDPNALLKDLIEEIGLPADIVSSIKGYVDLKPYECTPAELDGLLQTYGLTPGTAHKISQRYWLELNKERTIQERKQAMANMIQGFNQQPPSQPRSPWQQPPVGQPWQQQPYSPPGQPPQPGQPQWDWHNPPYPYPQYQPYPQQPYPPQQQMNRSEVDRMIKVSLDGYYNRIEQLILSKEKEREKNDEIADLRRAFYELMQRNNQPSPPSDMKPDPLLTEMMKNQSSMMNTLLAKSIEPKDDVELKMRLEQLRDEIKKKEDSLPSLSTKDELQMRIDLQKLLNEFNQTQEEYEDKQKTRELYSDLASGALETVTKAISDSFISGKKLPRGQVQPPQPPQQPPQIPQHPPQSPPVEQPPQPPQPPQQQQPPQPPSPQTERIVHDTEGNIGADGAIVTACPRCGSPLTIAPGATKIPCTMCGSVFGLKNPPTPVPTPPTKS